MCEVGHESAACECIQCCFFDDLQDAAYLRDLRHIQRHPRQLHLNNVQDGFLEFLLIDPFLVVPHHGVPVLAVHEPSGASVDQVVAQQAVGRDLGDVVDLRFSVIASELLSLILQAELVASAAVGGQVGDQLGVFPATWFQHMGHAFEQAFGVDQAVHPQLVDQHVHVIADVVPQQALGQLGEEFLEQCTDRLIANLAPKWRFGGSLDRLVVHQESSPFVLVPRECNGANARRVVLEAECLNVTGQVHAHFQQLVEGMFHFFHATRVELVLEDVCARVGIVASGMATQGFHTLCNLGLHLGWVVEDGAIVGHIHHLPWAEHTVHHVAQLGFRLAGFGEDLEVFGVGANDIFGCCLGEFWQQHRLHKFLHLTGRGFLLAGGLEQAEDDGAGRVNTEGIQIGFLDLVGVDRSGQHHQVELGVVPIGGVAHDQYRSLAAAYWKIVS